MLGIQGYNKNSISYACSYNKIYFHYNRSKLLVVLPIGGTHSPLNFGIDLTSGVVKLGHTGGRALATRGCAPPVQVLLKIVGAKYTVINCELGAKSAQRC